MEPVAQVIVPITTHFQHLANVPTSGYVNKVSERRSARGHAMRTSRGPGMTGTRTGRWIAAAAMLYGSVVLAQPPSSRPNPAPNPGPQDALGESKARQRIADQRAEAEVMQTLAEAGRTAKTNPARAVQQLRAAQNNLDLAVAISPETRRTLTALIQVKLNAINGGGAAAGPRIDPNGAAAKANQKAEFDRMVAEVKEVRDGISDIEKLRAVGRDADAEAIARRLSAKYPNNPSLMVLNRRDNTANNVAEARLFAMEQNDRVNKSFMSVDRSALPANGDVEFPKDWQAKTKHRLKQNEIQLTEREKKIITALDSPITVDFQGRPLGEVLQDLSTQLDQPLYLDEKSLGDLGADLKKPINLQARGLSGRTVLRQVLASQGLTFVVKDETIQVVTVEKARDMLVTRVYFLGDVVQGVGPFGGGATWGPYADYQQTMANVEVIIGTIESGVDPLCWKKNGGPCTITFHYPSMSIIVRAPAEVHATLGSKLGGGK